MSTKVKTGWLHDENGDKFAPKTLTSQVQTSDGTLLEDKLQADKNQVLLLTDSLSGQINDLQNDVEIKSNKTIEITKDSTDEQYPSAKATRDFLLNNSAYVTPEMYGAAGDGETDDTAAIQAAINAAANEDNIVYLYKKTYATTAPLVFNIGLTKFICDGIIKYTGAEQAILVTGQNITIDINQIYAENGTAVEFNAMEKSVLYCDVHVASISSSTKGFRMYTDSDYCISYNKFSCERISATDKGVEIWADTQWINENTISPGVIGTAIYGIYIYSNPTLNISGGYGTNDTTFVHGAIEGLQETGTAIYLSNTTGNSFEYIRCQENFGSTMISFNGQCSYNNINLSQMRLDFVNVTNLGENSFWNILKGDRHTLMGEYPAPRGIVDSRVADSMITYNPSLTNVQRYVSSGTFVDNILGFNGEYVIPTQYRFQVTAINGQTFTLSDIYSHNYSDAKGAVVTLTFSTNGGRIKLVDCNGDLIIDNSNGDYANQTISVQWAGCEFETQKNIWLVNANATETTAGLMSPEDKVKLNSIDDIVEEIEKLDDIVNIVSGETVAASDISSTVDVTLYGKSTQDGIPAPTSMVDIVSSDSFVLNVVNDKTAETQTCTVNMDSFAGLPVNFDGNYTDESGQRWVCDEIDYGRGVYIQRIGTVIYDGVSTYRKASTYAAHGASSVFNCPLRLLTLQNINTSVNLMCTHYEAKTNADLYNSAYDAASCAIGGTVRFDDSRFTALADFNAFLAEQYNAGTPVTIKYILAEPIEYTLSAENISAFAALQLNDTDYTLSTNSNAYIYVSYMANTSSGKYIGEMFNKKESVVNKISVIDSAATANQYPTVLAVKQYVDNNIPDIATTETSGLMSFTDKAKLNDIPDGAGYESYLSWGGKNLAGTYSPVDAAIVSSFGANRFAFMPTDAVAIEYSTDNGVTWEGYTSNGEDGKTLLCNDCENSISYYIGGSNATGIDKSGYMLRVTIDTTTATLYSKLNKFMVYCATNGSSGCYCTVSARTNANYSAGVDTWTIFADHASIDGWNGYNIINTDIITTLTSSSNYREIRFEFGVTSHPDTTSYSGLRIMKLQGYGEYISSTSSTLAKTGHLYSYDHYGNATFPRKVIATAFEGVATKAYKDNAENVIHETYLNKSGGTMTGALKLAADPANAMEAATKQYVDDNAGLKDSGWTAGSYLGTDSEGTVTEKTSVDIGNDIANLYVWEKWDGVSLGEQTRIEISQLDKGATPGFDSQVTYADSFMIENGKIKLINPSDSIVVSADTSGEETMNSLKEKYVQITRTDKSVSNYYYIPKTSTASIYTAYITGLKMDMQPLGENIEMMGYITSIAEDAYPTDAADDNGYWYVRGNKLGALAMLTSAEEARL